MNPTLQTNDLSIGYGQKVIAGKIDIELYPGSLIALVGANGVGKSTLLRTISGLLPAISGEVKLQGKNIRDYQPAQLARKIGLVLTEKLPAENLTVEELVSIGRQPYTNWIGTLAEGDRAAVTDALGQTGTTELRGKRINQLSDGQAQKVMIARALAQDTELIVLDEPATHLDLQHKFELFRLLRTLADSGKCVLYSTHDIETAIAISDSMIVMNHQKVLFGTPAALTVQGAFQTLFPESLVHFDPVAVKFIFKGL